MLASLSIRDIVLIDRLDLSFETGLSALTGETGAGKSILLGALGLACGERADRALVRNGVEQGGATAVFEVPAGHAVWAVLDEAGIVAEPGEPVILRRVVTADGRSRAHVNDQPASVGLLRQLGDLLVEIHGQHDGRGLLDPKTHRDLLDTHAQAGSYLKATAAAWKAVAAARARVSELREARDRALGEEEYLRHAVAELDQLGPKTGEEAELAIERKFLQQAEQALAELQTASDSLSGGDGMAGRLTSALRGLERVRDTLGAVTGEADEAGEGVAVTAQRALERATASLDRALIEFNEAEEALDEAGAAFQVEPGRLEAVEERLFALRAASRKHSVLVDGLAALREELATRLDLIEHADDRLKEAELALTAAEADYASAAKALSERRQAAAASLGQAVMGELGPLKMDRARFRVSVQRDEGRAGAKGWDQVAFEVSTNPGAPFGPLDKIASGGELSRFALALKVCLAGEDSGLVMVFDEVDQGVGGAVADAVGVRLARLASTGQALVVTHSPQVAARARHHWKIEKGDAADGVRTTVRGLDGEARREEIARMLSGAEVTEAARAAADQLMAS